MPNIAKVPKTTSLGTFMPFQTFSLKENAQCSELHKYLTFDEPLPGGKMLKFVFLLL